MVATSLRTQSARPVTSPTLRSFFLATFALSWGAGVLMTVFSDRVAALFGPMEYTNPVFIFVVYAPGIVAVVLVARHYGIRGLGRFFRRLTFWRMSVKWWLIMLVGMPAVVYAGAAINGTLGDPFPFTPWFSVLPALLPAVLIGPIEELGWRGIALPLLQRRFAPLWSALILGGVWAVWHAPAFFLMSDVKQSTWAFGPFVVGVVAVSLILTPMFNAARGSLLVAFLFHAQMNNPIWPEAQPWDMYLFAAVAVLVVMVNRKTMFSRGTGVTAILGAVGDPMIRHDVPSTAVGASTSDDDAVIALDEVSARRG